MNVASKLLSAIDKALGADPAVENMARPPRGSQTVVVPPGQPEHQHQTGGTGIFRATEGRESLRETPKLSADAARELKVTIIPKAPPGAFSGVPFPTLEQERGFQAAVRERGFEVPRATVAALEKLDVPWARLATAMGTYSDGAARQKYQEHVADMTRKISAGDSSVDEHDAWTEGEWKEDFMLRRQSIKAEMRMLETQAAALVKPVKLAYAEALTALADDIERPLIEVAESFKCPHKPSPTVLLIRKAAEVASDERQTPNGRPNLMLGELLS